MTLVGDLDISTIAEAEALVREALAPGVVAISLDMKAVTFFSVAGVRLLVELLQQGLHVELVDASRQMRRVIEICGLRANPLLTFRDRAGDQQELDI